MTSSLYDIVSGWGRSWELPDVWIALCAGEEPPASGIFDSLLQRLALPLSPQEIFQELIDRGEFTAADEFARTPSSTEAIPLNQLDALLAELARRREAEWQTVETACAIALFRAERSGLVDAGLVRSTESAKEAVHARRVVAEQILAQIDADLTSREAVLVRELQQDLASRPARATPRSRWWQSTISQLLAAREINVARGLLDAGPHEPYNQADHQAPRRPEWPYEDAPLRVCRWFRSVDRVPADFRARWAAAPDDAPARALVQALESLLEGESSIREETVARFVSALEGFVFDETPEDAPLVARRGSLFWTTLRIPRPKPATLAHLLPVAFPLVVAVGGVPADIEEVAPRCPHLLFPVTESVGWPNRFLRLHPELLFRLVGDRPNRRINFLRELGKQIPLQLALLDAAPAPTVDAFVGREKEMNALREAKAPVLILGPRGIGRTSLLLKRMSELSAQGWGVITVRHVAESADTPAPARLVIEQVRRQMCEWHGDGQYPPLDTSILEWVQGLSVPGIFITLDDIDAVLGSAAEINSLCAELRMLTETSEGRITFAAACGEPVVEENLVANVLVLGPLSFPETLAWLVSMTDFLGLRFNRSELADRLAFYSGGHPSLLYLLLWELLQRLGMRPTGTRAPVDEELVELAWHAVQFRSAAQELLLGPLAARPKARLVLGCVLELLSERRTRDGIAESDLVEWLALYELGAFDTLSALHQLCQHGLVKRSADAHYMLPTSGVGQLLTSLIADASRYAMEANAELVSCVTS